MTRKLLPNRAMYKPMTKSRLPTKRLTFFQALVGLAEEYAEEAHEGFVGRVTLDREDGGRWLFRWDGLPLCILSRELIVVARAEYGKPISYFTTATVQKVIGVLDEYVAAEAFDEHARVTRYRVLALKMRR